MSTNDIIHQKLKAHYNEAERNVGALLQRWRTENGKTKWEDYVAEMFTATGPDQAADATKAYWTAFTDPNPITITTGGTYSGFYRSTNPAVPAVTVNTTQPVILDHARIEHAGVGVETFSQGDLTIRDCVFQQLDPGGGLGSNRAVYAYSMLKLVLENNLLYDGAGFYWQAETVLPTEGRVRYNVAYNIGRYPSATLLSFFQTNNVTVPGLEVAWNEVHNTPLQSDVEDIFNFYQSNGTALAPFDMHHNLVDGGYPTTLGPGTYNGAGITLGDSGGSYQRAHHNWFVGCVNTGANIPAGSNIELDHNVIVTDGLANGTPTGPDYGVGLSLWDNPAYAGTPTNCSVHDNTVGFNRVEADSDLIRQDYFVPQCGLNGNTCSNNTSMPEPITVEDEQQAIADWNAARLAAGVTTGPRP